MYCFQCQETIDNQYCDLSGICGKNAEIGSLQDLLVYALKGLSVVGEKAAELGVTYPATHRFVAGALFATLTNVNFDPNRLVSLIKETLTRRDALRDRFFAAYQKKHGQPFVTPLPEMATWYFVAGTRAEFERKGETVGITALGHPNADIQSLRELITYGVKGLAAYMEHVAILGQTNPDMEAYMLRALAFTTVENATLEQLVGVAMECGKFGVDAMAMLDQAHTTRYGHPEPTPVNLGVKNGPGILISGHDLLDLEELLEQTAGKGINIYTHGEMLPAHAYPFFKKYPHLVGNYGGAWWEQKENFTDFNGPIVMTTNCLQKPMPAYADRLFTTGVVGWEGTPHLADRAPGASKDFGPVIQKALACPPPTSLENGTITIGFAHKAILDRAEAVIAAVKSGAVKRFVVMAGCDGRQPERDYYTDIAAGLPQDAIILTAGCAKYRYNKLNLGDIGGIPRVLDAGQCNDSFSLVMVALKLAEAFGVESVNDLPISYDIAWYEQKAVLVLLALLHLNVKKIRLGPTLPAFLSPNVVNFLVENFELKPIGTVEDDLAAIMAGN